MGINAPKLGAKIWKKMLQLLHETIGVVGSCRNRANYWVNAAITLREVFFFLLFPFS